MSFFVAGVGVRAQLDIAPPKEPERLLALARFRDCLSAADTSPAGTLLRLRALLYLGEHHTVIRTQFLDTINALPIPERGRATALLATAYFRSGMPGPAQTAVAEAYRLVGNDPVGLPEVQFYDGLQSWARNDLEQSEWCVNALLSLPQWRGKALSLRSWIRSNRHDYAGQLSDLLAAYAAIQHEDVWEKATILRSASALARELFAPETAALLERYALSLSWSAETSEHEFYTFRNLAWCSALGGRSLTAYGHLARAERCIPSDAHAVLVYADRALIAKHSGERDTSRINLEAARYAANQAQWIDSGEARTALLLLAELVEDPQEAWALVERYTKIASNITPLLAFGNGDLRLEALEQYYAGRVYEANGKRDAAITAYKKALGIWLGCKYRWRAALAAFHLGELQGREHYLDTARQLIDSNAPHAFFARILDKYRARLEHPDVIALPQHQRDVLFAFTAGLTNREIAARLDVAEQTVKNTLRQIYHAFGAKSGRDLWPILRSRGIA